MARETCIQHPKGHYFLALRSHIIKMFGGDHCAAAVFAVFEFATTDELSRMERCGKSADPWVCASMISICNDTVGLYSIRSLQERVHWLQELGFLREQAAPGKVTKYLLDIEAANEAIDKRQVFDPGKIADVKQSDPGKIADATPAKLPGYPGKTIGKIADEGGVLILKEEELRTREEQHKNTNPVSQDFFKSETQNQSQNQTQQDLPPDSAAPPSHHFDVVKILVSRLKSIGIKVNADSRRQIAEFNSERLGLDVVLEKLEDFGKQDYWRDYKNPTAAFFKSLENGSGSNGKSHRPAPAAAPARSTEPGSRETSSSALADAPALPDYVLRWNAAVPEPMHLGDWSEEAPRKQLAKASGDPEFVKGFDKICQRCREYFESGKMTDLEFPWLFRMSQGQINWYAVLHGAFSWAGGSEAKTSVRPKGMFELAQERLEKHRKEKLNGTAKTDTETASPATGT